MASIIDLLRQLPTYEAQIETWQLMNIQIADHRPYLTGNQALPMQNVYGNIQSKTLSQGMTRWYNATGAVDIPMQWLEQQIYPFFDQVCNAYPTANSKMRAGVRQAFLMHSSVLLMLGSYVSHASGRIQTEHDVHWLQRGLASVAIMDNIQMGTNSLIGGLYLSAYHARINPDPHFQAAVELCSAQPSKYGLDDLSMRDFLSEFKNSAFFRNEIAPKL